MAQQTNGNDPISATQEYHSKNFGVVLAKTGLTKREYFAAMAMQGMIASGKINIDHIPNLSVFYSDALIEALNKEK